MKDKLLIKRQSIVPQIFRNNNIVHSSERLLDTLQRSNLQYSSFKECQMIVTNGFYFLSEENSAGMSFEVNMFYVRCLPLSNSRYDNLKCFEIYLNLT